MAFNSLLTLSTLLPLLHLISTDDSTPNSGRLYLSRTRNGAGRPDYGEYYYDDHRPRWGNPRGIDNTHVNQKLAASLTSQLNKQQPKHSVAKFKLIPNWPDPSKQLGQLSAVSIDTDGNVVVFHRGDRTWNALTFSLGNVYTEQQLGAIQQSTIVVFNITSGLVVEEYGSNMFYLPHGLTVDSENNIWVTDVALHQVFKFPAGKPEKPSLVLGTRFVPGNDDNHFCKPTDVAILSNGDFFVSDGYCNFRILKFDKTGRKLMQWGRSTVNGLGSRELKPPPDHFLVPHALAVAEDKNMLFVADRENGRIQCFDTTSGVYITQFHSDIMGPRIFSVAYAPVHGGLLYIINGPGTGERPFRVEGFVVSLATNEFVATFNSDGGLQNPHDVAVTKDGSQVFVVELNPYKVWKFVQGNVNITTPVLPAKTGNVNVSVNTSSTLQAPAKLKLSTTAKKESVVTDERAEQTTGSVAAGIVIIVSMVLVIIVVVAVVIARIRRGRSSEQYTGLNDMYYEE